jgi:hypothetical protein
MNTVKFPESRMLKALVLSVCCTGLAQAAEPRQVNMLLVVPSAQSYASHINGVILGETEANIQGRFMGINYALVQVTPDEVAPGGEKPAVVFVAGTSEQVLRIYDVYAPQGVPVVNVALGDNALREQCHPGLFHTPPSEKMLADAVAQWQQVNPGETVQAMAWHPDFVKFAGRDLNKRYMEQFSIEMDSDAWAGWAASRMVAEAVGRTGSEAPETIADYLNETLEFDGQKGVPQSFRENGQMRQTLLLADASGELLGEAPVRGVADSEDLDSMGILTCE